MLKMVQSCDIKTEFWTGAKTLLTSKSTSKKSTNLCEKILIEFKKPTSKDFKKDANTEN